MACTPSVTARCCWPCPPPGRAVAAARGSGGRCGSRQCPHARQLGRDGALPRPVPLPWDGAFINDGPLRWVARDSSKPGRTAPRHGNLAAARQPQMEQAHIEDSADTVTATLLAAFAALGGPCHTPRAGHGPPLALCRHRTCTHPRPLVGCHRLRGHVRRLAQRRQGGRRVAQRPIAGASIAAGPLNQRARHAHAQKQDLPQKTCLHCGLPFTWRKKWEKVWDEVKYCSDRCRSERKRTGNAAGRAPYEHCAVLVPQRPAPASTNPRCAQRSPAVLPTCPVVCLPAPDERTPWGFARVGAHRRAFTAAALRGLQGQMSAHNPLLICQAPRHRLAATGPGCGCHHRGVRRHCRPYEQAEVAALRAAGLQVRTVWHSSLLPPVRMPWPVDQLPGVFTTFRQKVERAGITPPRHCPCPPNCCRHPRYPCRCCKPWAQSRALPASSNPHRPRAATPARPSPRNARV